MKRKLSTLFALTAFLLTCFASGAAQTSGATQVVNAFYGWYFANQANWTNLSGARQFFTPALYAPLEKVIEQEKREQAEILDFNPFVDAQIEAQSYATGTSSGNGATVSVPVSLRFPHSKEPGILHVIVRRGPSGWKIDNFVYPDNGNLRRTLQDALK